MVTTTIYTSKMHALTILASPSATLLSNLSMGFFSFGNDGSSNVSIVCLTDDTDVLGEEDPICRGGVFISLTSWL